MRQSVTLVTAPQAEPVTLNEFKEYARLDGGNSEDATLTELLVAARQEAEKYLNRALITQTWKLTLDLESSSADAYLGDGVFDLPITALYGALPSAIDLPYAPAQSITSVTTYDLNNTGTVYSAANYSIDTAGSRLVLNNGSIWPSNLRPVAAMVILYVTGYGAGAQVPAAIKLAIKKYASSLYEERGVCEDSANSLNALHNSLFSYRRFGNG